MAAVTNEFKESQKFTQWWIWLIIAVIYLSPFMVKFNSIVENGFWGTFSKGILAHIISLGLLIILFALLELKTEVNTSGIKIHYFPLFKKEFPREEIREIKAVQYGIFDVGGWGIRWFTNFGTAYNVKGNQGIVLKLNSGKNYMIGTQHPKAFLKAFNDH